MRKLTSNEFQSFKEELKKVAINCYKENEIGHLADGTKVNEKYHYFITKINTICICEFNSIKEQGILCLVV